MIGNFEGSHNNIVLVRDYIGLDIITKPKPKPRLLGFHFQFCRGDTMSINMAATSMSDSI